MDELLSPQDVAKEVEMLDAWSLTEDSKKLERSYEFPDFKSALAFVDSVGALAKAAQHHPDIEFGWGRAKIVLSTHSLGGISSKDIDLAKKIDALPR